MKAGQGALISDQLTKVPAVLTADLSGKNVVVVGANSGLGLEATKHFARMKPARLILACRSEQRGSAAIKEVEAGTQYRGAELMIVDLARFASVEAFAAKIEAEALAIDILVVNAAVIMPKHELSADGWEQTLQVNTLSAMLLSVLLVPAALRAAQARPGSNPRSVIVGSAVHYMATFPKNVLSAPNIMAELNKPENYGGGMTEPRYSMSKLLSLIVTRKLAEHLAKTPIITVSPNPGYCYSGLRQNYGAVQAMIDRLMEKVLARTTEEGSRDLVFAAVGGGDEMRGAYTNLQKVQEPSDTVLGKAGEELQNRVWNECVDILSKVSPTFKAVIDQHLS